MLSYQAFDLMDAHQAVDEDPSVFLASCGTGVHPVEMRRKESMADAMKS
jgi:hypothetical protein